MDAEKRTEALEYVLDALRRVESWTEYDKGFVYGVVHALLLDSRAPGPRWIPRAARGMRSGRIWLHVS